VADSPTIESDLVRGIRSMLQTMRWSMERPYQSLTRHGDAEGAHAFKRILLAIEAVRISFSPKWEPNRPIIREHAIGLLGELRALLANNEFRRYARSTPFQLVPGAMNDRQRYLPFDVRMLERKTVEDAAKLLVERLEAEIGLARGENLKLDMNELRRVVPDQKIAPVQFQIRNERLALLHQKSRADDEDCHNVEVAKQELESAGKRILNELERSNCDKRLIDSVRRLQEQLKADSNIVTIGLSNLTCEAMCHAFEHELPDAVGAMLRAHTRGVELYVGQFPEWHRFVENAASVQLDQNDVNALSSTAAQLVAKLEGQPELAEPEVPETIKRINELLKNPAKAGKRAAFAMLRTLENLISQAFSHGADLLEDSIAQAKQKVSSTIGRAAAVLLLAIALESAIAISPVAGKVAEAQWLRSAIELIQKHIHDLKK
jgi:hypothetical protein